MEDCDKISVTDRIAYFDRRDSAMEAKKERFKPAFEEVATLVRPEENYFSTKNVRSVRAAVMAKVDDTAIALMPAHCATMNSLLTPAAYQWENFIAYDEGAQTTYGAALSAQAQFLHQKRYSAESGWVGAIMETYANLCSFGFAVMELIPNIGKKRFTYKSHSCSEFTIDSSNGTTIDTFHRKTKYTYRQLHFLFPNYMPDKYKDRTDTKWLEDKVELMQCVEPNFDNPDKWDNVYIDKTNKQIIQETQESYPVYVATRAFVLPLPDCPYAYSPLMMVMPSIKALNSLQFNVLKMTDNAARDDYLINTDSVNPNNLAGRGLLIEGGIDDDGRAMISRMNNPDIPTVDYLIKSYQEKIKMAMFVNYSQTFSETQSRSATDAVLKANEKANTLSPYGDRIMRELLIPMIEAEIAFYGKIRELPMFPEGAEGLEYRIVIDNPMLKAQRLDAANGVMTMAQYMAQLKGMSEEFNMDRTKNLLADILNVPANTMNTPEEKQEILQAREQQVAAEAVLNNVGGIGSAVKDITDAENAYNAGQQA